jgi:hypothetical protein
VAGGTVAPAAGIVASMVTGTVNWLDADLTAIVTHNFALSTSELAQLFPLSSREIDPSNAGTIVPVVSVTKTTNNVTYTKVSAAGSGGTFQFFLQRPNTIVR